MNINTSMLNIRKKLKIQTFPLKYIKVETFFIFHHNLMKNILSNFL